MLQNESILTIADNSGAKEVLVIRCLGGSKRLSIGIGDLFIGTVKKAIPSSSIKKGQIVMGLVVTTKKYFHRQNNTWVKFSKNCAVLIKKEDKSPLGTRIFVPLLSEFDQWGYKKILSLAPETL